jgi:hypothetical protein
MPLLFFLVSSCSSCSFSSLPRLSLLVRLNHRPQLAPHNLPPSLTFFITPPASPGGMKKASGLGAAQVVVQPVLVASPLPPFKAPPPPPPKKMQAVPVVLAFGGFNGGGFNGKQRPVYSAPVYAPIQVSYNGNPLFSVSSPAHTQCCTYLLF